MSASSLIAGMLRNSAQDMKRAYDKMPEDRKAWHPTVDGNTGRDAKDQVIECALINGWVAGVLNVGGIPDFAFSEDTNAKYTANGDKL